MYSGQVRRVRGLIVWLTVSPLIVVEVISDIEGRRDYPTHHVVAHRHMLTQQPFTQ
jgi:hypothetical protein